MTAPLTQYLSNNNNGKGKKKKLIIKALRSKKEPLTRRQLSEITGLEICSLCGPLFDLVYKCGLLEVSVIKPCDKTGKRVFHYYFKREA